MLSSSARAVKGVCKQISLRPPPRLRPSSCASTAHFTISQRLCTDDKGHAPDKDLSHFFDKQTIPSSASVSTESVNRPSYEVVSQSKKAVASFRSDVASRSSARIIAGYAALVQAFEQHRAAMDAFSSRPFKLDHSFPLRKNDIQTAIRFLVQNAKTKRYMDRKSLAASQQMFRDLAARFGYSHGPTDLHYQLQSYCLQDTNQGVAHDPMQVFQDLRAANPDWQTSSVEWNMVATYLAKTLQYDRACQLCKDMALHGTEPETSFQATMTSLHLRFNDVGQAESHLQSIKQQNGSLSIEVLTAAVEGYCDLFQADSQQRPLLEPRVRGYAEQLRSALHACTTSSDNIAAWHAFLRYQSLLDSQTQALQTARQLGRRGGLDGKTVAQLLRLQTDDLRSLQTSDEALALLDRVLDLNSSHMAKTVDEAYQVLMLALLGQETDSKRLRKYQSGLTFVEDQAAERDPTPTPNQIREAQMLYDHLRSTGVRLGPQVVAPLLTAYCEAFLPSLSAAMKLFRYLLQEVQARPASDGAASALGMNIISPVINACVKLRDLSAANDLITRMRKAGMSMEAKDKLHIACRLMPIATTWREAFAVYQSVWRVPLADYSRPGYDENGYGVLLDTFRKLSCTDDEFDGSASEGAESPAPPEYMLCIVEDMRRAGYQPSCIVYTTILDYYSKLSTPSYEGVQATHDLLKCDESLEPDLPLINALMNAYNRAREPSVVLAIWDSLMATRQDIDGVTLSIFFDTCGRHGLLQRARNALSSIRRTEADKQASSSRAYRQSAMNKGAWDSYLECLSRCGRLEEAIELMFGEMRRALLREAINANILADDSGTITLNDLLYRQTQEPVRTRTGQAIGPDVKTFGTLLRFAARERDKSLPLPLKSFFPTTRFSKSAVEPANNGPSVWHTLRQRIKEEYSWIYPSIEYIGESSSSQP